jgi:hypothetical protein
MKDSQNSLRVDGERIGAVLLVLLLLTFGLLAADGVYASLSGRATGAESVSSGTLDLALSRDSGAGFSTFAGMLAPGDTDNVYVNLTNTGTLASAAGMRLWVGAVPASPLSNGAAAGEGLTVRLTRCSVAWTLATGTCTGATTNMLAATQVRTMNTLATARALANVPALAVGGSVAHVQVTLGLVGTEKSLNGVPPAKTIQGHPATLTYTFIEQQRVGVVTNH